MMRFDVIVAGFGTAGAMAAVTLAERGIRLLVLEKSTYAGGMHSGGGITGFYLQPPRGPVKILHDEALAFAGEQGLGLGEAKKILYERRVVRQGGTIRYGAQVVGVLRDGDRVEGVRWIDDLGEHSARAAIVVDATADAGVLRAAGLPVSGGRRADGRFQPYTWIGLYARVHGAYVANFDAGYLDQTRAEDISGTFVRDAAAHMLPSCDGEARILAPADRLGVREGPRLVPAKPVTLADALAGDEREEETVDYVYSNIDTHTHDLALESELLRDWLIGASMWGTELYFAVPRRALHPEGVKGLLGIGRHLGVDHDLGHAVRMNACMGATGVAAALMGACAVRRGCAPDEAPYSEWAGGMDLPASPLRENRSVWRLDDPSIVAGLDSDAPGRAQWSVRAGGRTALCRDLLARHGADTRIHRHAAMALALAGDGAGVETLRRMIAEKDGYAPENSRRYNHARGYAAVHLVGRLRDRGAIPLLAGLLARDDYADVFHYQTHAVAALLAIGEAHPGARREVVEALGRVKDGGWTLWHALKGMFTSVPNTRFDFAPMVRAWADRTCQAWEAAP